MPENTVDMTVSLKDQASAAYRQIFEDIQKRNKEVTNSLRDAGRKLWEETRTPLEKYRMGVANIERLYKQGAISMDTFRRASKQAADEFTRDTSLISKAWGSLPFVGGMSGPAGAALAAGAALTGGLSIGSQYQDSIFQMRKTFEGESDRMIAKARELSESMKQYYSFNEVSYSFVKTADSMERYGITGDRYMQLVTRAMDVGAAKGLELRETIDRIESAMRGEAEASEYLGVTLNDTYMKSIAFNGSLKDQWETMADNEKAYYRWQELMKQTGKYQGSAKDATENLSGALKRMKNTVWDDAAPALEKLAGLAATVANKMTDAAVAGKQWTNAEFMGWMRQQLKDATVERSTTVRKPIPMPNAEWAYASGMQGAAARTPALMPKGYQDFGKAAADWFEQTRTPLEKYNASMKQLKQIYDTTDMSRETFERGQAALKKELDEATKKASGASKEINKFNSEAKQLSESLRTPAEVYTSELSRYQQFLDAGLISTQERNRAIEKLEKDLFKGISVADLESIQAVQAAKWKDAFAGTPVGGDVGIRTGGTFNSIASSAREAQQKIGEMSQFAIQAARNIQNALGDTMYSMLTGRWNDIGSSFGDMLARMGSDILSSYVNKWLFGSFGTSGDMGGLLGWVGGKLFHEGGIVGQSAAATRMVNPAIFAHAPRLHSGLAPDEFPAILQRGERVIPKSQANSYGHRINMPIQVVMPQGSVGQGSDPAVMKYLGNIIAGQIKAEMNKNLSMQLRPGGLLNKGVNR